MKTWMTLILLLVAMPSFAKEIALSFDDAPGDPSPFFSPVQRTDELIKKLKTLNIPPVIIFANPCKGGDVAQQVAQMRKFKDEGHIIGNHTCTHPRLDEVGYDSYTSDILEGEKHLAGLLTSPKLFRYPFFNEGKDVAVRDKVRAWLKANNYRNVSASIDNDDTMFAAKLHQAYAKGRKIDQAKLKKVFVDHVVTGAEFFEKKAKEVLGRSPKHIVLLHQKDATVLFLEDLVKELRARGWKIIDANEALKDPLYGVEPGNTLTYHGLIGQIANEKDGNFKPYYTAKSLGRDIDKVLK